MFSTQPNTKFGVLALRECSAHLDETVDLGDGVSAHPTCPIDLPEHWQRWLGELQRDAVLEANLLIGIEQPSQTPTVTDAETSAIHNRLQSIWQGVLLQGVPSYQRSVIVLGGVDADGTLAVKRVAMPPRAYRHQFGRALDISADVVRTAMRLGDAQQSLDAARPDYRRVRAGFRALIMGIEEPLANERLHQFVRALDGLMMIPAGQGRGTFAERGATFVSGADLHDLLIELFLLRNAQEHLNDFKTVIVEPAQEAFDLRFSRRAYQAEMAALSSYRRLLTSPNLLAHFRTEATIDAFWQLGQTQRHALWWLPFDLDAAAREHDYLFQLLYQ